MTEADKPLCLDLVYDEVLRVHEASVTRRRHVTLKGLVYLIAAPLILAPLAFHRLTPLPTVIVSVGAALAAIVIAACLLVAFSKDRWTEVGAASALARYVDEPTRPEWHSKVIINNTRADAVDKNTASLNTKARWTAYASYALTIEVMWVALAYVLYWGMS